MRNPQSGAAVVAHGHGEGAFEEVLQVVVVPIAAALGAEVSVAPRAEMAAASCALNRLAKCPHAQLRPEDAGLRADCRIVVEPQAEEGFRGKGAFAQYIGAGGQEINAWMRGMLLLMPTIEPGVYELSAVKRGNRLGWTNPPGKNYLFPTKLIRQSPKEDHLLFWYEIGVVPESLQSKGFKEKRDPAVGAQELVERVDAPKTAGELRQMARETFGKQHGDRVQSELVHNFSKYGLVMLKGANNNVQIYGREEMFK